MDAKAKLTAARIQIRWMATWITVLVWIIVTMMARVQGQTLAHASTIALVTVVGGLIAWVIYHTISRRNNGVGIFILAVAGAIPARDQIILSLNEELTRRTFALTVLASASFVYGLLHRYGVFVRRSRKANEQTDRSPLWDAEVDPPSSG